MRKGKAFTLIELLVVISIITLLMAILIPVLGRARELGHRTVFVDVGWTPTSSDFYVYYLYPKWKWCSPPPIYHRDGVTLSMADGHAEYWKWRSLEILNFPRELLLAGNLSLNMVTEVYMVNSGLLEGGIKC